MLVPLTCTLTGIAFGTISIQDDVPGRQPYCTGFKEATLLHPVFSLALPKRVALLRNSIERHLAGLEVDDRLELSFLATLHGMHCLKIPQVHNPILPTRTTTISNAHKLLTIANWHIARPSYKFPLLVLSPENTNEKLENIKDYLSLIVDLIEGFKRKKEIFDEEERAEIQARAISSIRRPEKIAKRTLWRWCENHIIHSTRLAPSIEKLKSLFFSTGKDITRLDRDDLEFLLTSLESILPLGTPLLTEVRKHCESMLTVWEDHYKAFYVVDTVAAMWASLPGDEIEEKVHIPKEEIILTDEPRPEDFSNRTQFIIARAKWQLQKG
jgi:hypothetical protein